MTFAIIADIHGNSAALAAVLDDMDTLGVTDAVNLGDHFSGPLDAAGTADMLIPRGFPSIRGNHDRWLIETDPAEMNESDKVAHAQLTPRDLDWLRAQPAAMTFLDDVYLCHGTPTSDTTYWLEEVHSDAHVTTAPIARIETDAAGIDASLILCGHTHIARIVRLSDGRLIVNPGSVGCPGYGNDIPVQHVMQVGHPLACYAIAARSADEWRITFRQVPYERTGMIALARERGRTEWARALETGWVS